MANVIGIIGDSSTGKSTSIEGLNPKETYLINVLNKDLPFRNSKNMYSFEKKNLACTDEWDKVVTILKGVSDTRPEIKNIILDDIGFVMTTEFFKRASESGYTKYSQLGQHMFQIIHTAKTLREDLNVFFMFHSEEIADINGNVSKRILTVGKMLAEKYNPNASFTISLYSDVEFDKNGEPFYHFITNRVPGIPAKSPKGMFQELKIPNNLQYVVDQINSYYNDSEN